MKTGIVDVGGGTRGIYGAGVFDRLIEDGVQVDHTIGVSAGSANAASYLAGQKGRNYRFYNDYAFRKEYMSVSNLVRTGSYIDFDYIYSTLSDADGEDPLDYEAMMRNPAGMDVVATDAETGETVYFTKEDLEKNNYFPMKASCCVPVIDQPYPVKGRSYFDGGLSNPIPYDRAFAQGCDKVVVILTRPKEDFRDGARDRAMARLLHKTYPAIEELLCARCDRYNLQLGKLLQLEKDGKALIVAPDDISGLKTLSKDHASLETLYRKGWENGAAIRPFLFPSSSP